MSNFIDLFHSRFALVCTQGCVRSSRNIEIAIKRLIDDLHLMYKKPAGRNYKMCCRFTFNKTGCPNTNHLLQNIWKQRFGVLFIMLITTSICTWYAWRLPKVYESKAILEIKLVDNYFPLNRGRKKQINRRLTDAINRELLNDSSIDSLVIQNVNFREELENNRSIEAIRNRIRRSLTVEGGYRRNFDTVVFSLSYRDTDPENARLVLFAMTEKLKNSYWESTNEYLGSNKVIPCGYTSLCFPDNSVKVLSPPDTPYRPVGPRKFRIVSFGLLSGLFLGMFLATIYGLPELFRGEPE